MDRQEMNALIGLTEDEMDAIGTEYESDAWDSTQLGKVIIGRPPLFEEAMGTISFKESKPVIERVNARAASLGMSRSDYMRRLVERDLATA